MHIDFKTLAATLSIGLLTQPALAEPSAQDGVEKYLFGTVSYVEPDDDRVTGKGIRLDLGLGREIAPQWFAEAVIAGNIFNGPLAQKDLYAAAALVNVQWTPMQRGQQWAPFVEAGLGLSKNEDFGALAQAGLGIVSPDLTSYKLRVRLQTRASYDDAADGATDYSIGAGLEFPFGQQLIVETIEVDRIVEKVVYRAPPDADNDGVANADDRCPGTMAGSRVDATGCTISGQAIKLEGVNFASSSDQLSAESYTTLNAAVTALQGQPAARVLIKGHTDSSGSASSNLTLSQKRADAVKRYFISQGIAAARISAQGFGETQPVANNDTVAGRALNRRVELELSN